MDPDDAGAAKAEAIVGCGEPVLLGEIPAAAEEDLPAGGGGGSGAGALPEGTAPEGAAPTP